MTLAEQSKEKDLLGWWLEGIQEGLIEEVHMLEQILGIETTLPEILKALSDSELKNKICQLKSQVFKYVERRRKSDH